MTAIHYFGIRGGFAVLTVGRFLSKLQGPETVQALEFRLVL
jgi:hypothetical protein